MRTHLSGLIGLVPEADAMTPAAAPAETVSRILCGGLGPFFVRRFVDFARTELMICRLAA